MGVCRAVQQVGLKFACVIWPAVSCWERVDDIAEYSPLCPASRQHIERWHSAPLHAPPLTLTARQSDWQVHHNVSQCRPHGRAAGAGTAPAAMAAGVPAALCGWWRAATRPHPARRPPGARGRPARPAAVPTPSCLT